MKLWQWSVIAALLLIAAAHADLSTSGGNVPVTQSGAWTVAATQSGAWTDAVTQSGTWTVQPGNTANSTAWLVQLPASSATVIASATTTAVKATAGTLRRITVTTEVVSGTVKLFDLASASCTGTPSTNPKAILTMPATLSNPFTAEFQQSFANGICVLTSTGTWNLTVIFD